jgi:hypothetical protein
LAVVVRLLQAAKQHFVASKVHGNYQGEFESAAQCAGSMLAKL